MPHYRDGSRAVEGDRVSGTTYNQKELVEGILLRITSQGAACNCIVQFDGGLPYPEGSAGRDWDYSATGDLEQI